MGSFIVGSRLSTRSGDINTQRHPHPKTHGIAARLLLTPNTSAPTRASISPSPVVIGRWPTHQQGSSEIEWEQNNNKQNNNGKFDMKTTGNRCKVFQAHRMTMIAIIALTSGTAFAGSLYTAWTGRGDGHSWNDGNNWKGALDNSDPAAWVDGVKPYNAHHNYIQIDTDIDGFTGVLTNDLGNLNYVDNLTIKGSKSITIVGDYQLGFRTGNTKGIDASTSGEVTFDCRIEVYNYPYLMFQGPSRVNFLKDVYLDGRWRMNDDTSPSSAEMHFYGTVSGSASSYLEMVYGDGHVSMSCVA